MKDFIKQKLNETLTRFNSLSVEITRPDQTLIIMRGVPGAGKSTKAKTLIGEGIIHSTDTIIESTGDYNAFFAEMIKTGKFGNLSRMHSKNLAEAKISMEVGITPVIIDNTNIRANEAKAYVEYALRMGFADGNIQIVDVGTAGLTAEQLAARNTHGVPVDKIKDMIKNHASTGELTVKKIIESKDMYTNDILYSAVVLDEKSRSKLLGAFRRSIPDTWKTIAHHMTIAFGKAAPKKEDVGKTVELTVTELGKSDMAIAVKVEGYESNNKIPHITLAVNENEGGKPVMSNDITDWKEVAEGLVLKGIVTNIKK